MTVPRIWRKIPEQYNLAGKKCNSCSELFFPPRDVCIKCGSMDMAGYLFEGRGKIVTFSIIRTQYKDTEVSESAFRNTPYALAIIGLNEGPLVTSEIVDCDFSEVEIGKKAEVVFRKILEKGEKGVIQYGYKFRLADN